MVITTTELDAIKTEIIDNIVLGYTHVGFGTGTATPTPSDSTLVAQILRQARQEYTETASRVTIAGYLNASQANGNTVAEVGVFNAISGGNLKTRNTYSTAIVKTTDKEVWTDTTLTITVTQ